MDTILETLKVIATEYALKVVGVVVVFIVASWLSKKLQKLVVGIAEKRKLDLTIGRVLGTLVRTGIMAFAVISILGVFGIETASFAVVLGAAGLAIGLAFQGSLGNLSAGVMLLIFRPFKVGDVITVAGTTGKVYEISLFTTLLDTPDNRRIIVPNGTIFGSTIENITHHATRRADINVGADYGASLEETRDVLLKAAATVEGGLSDPAPAVVCTGLGDSSVDWQVRIWCNTADTLGVIELGTRVVKNALDEAGIGIPFPQMDVHLDKVEG